MCDNRREEKQNNQQNQNQREQKQNNQQNRK